MLACRRAASGSLVAPWTRREFSLAGLGKRQRSQNRVNKPCSPGQRTAQIALTVKANARKLPSCSLCFTPSADDRSTRLHPNAWRPWRSYAPKWAPRGDGDVAVSGLACPWATAVPGLAEPLGLSRTTPLECLNGSIARPSWLVAFRFRYSGFGDFAGNRRALQYNASWNHKSIPSSSARSCLVGQGTQGPRQLSPRAHVSSSQVSFTWLWQTRWAIRQTKRLDLAVWCLPDFSHLCPNSEIPDVPIPNVST